MVFGERFIYFLYKSGLSKNTMKLSRTLGTLIGATLVAAAVTGYAIAKNWPMTIGLGPQTALTYEPVTLDIRHMLRPTSTLYLETSDGAIHTITGPAKLQAFCAYRNSDWWSCTPFLATPIYEITARYSPNKEPIIIQGNQTPGLSNDQWAEMTRYAGIIVNEEPQGCSEKVKRAAAELFTGVKLQIHGQDAVDYSQTPDTFRTYSLPASMKDIAVLASMYEKTAECLKGQGKE